MIKDLVGYLDRLERELIMRSYLDGWYIKWLENKIIETKNKIECLKK
jgi:hypothetical protein